MTFAERIEGTSQRRLTGSMQGSGTPLLLALAVLVLGGCADPALTGAGTSTGDEVVLTLGKRSAPWPDEVARATDDGLVEVLEGDAVVEEAWAALDPDALPTGGDPATSVEEGAHLPPEQLPDGSERVVVRVRHVESSSCPVRVDDLTDGNGRLMLALDDGGTRACTDDANPFTALIAVHADRLPPRDDLPDEVSAGEHWTLELRRVSTVEDLAGTTDPEQDRDRRSGGFSVEPSTPEPGDELAATFPPEDPHRDPDDVPADVSGRHERGVLFTLDRRSGDTWMLQTHLISDRDPGGARTLEPVSDGSEVDEPADVLVDDAGPDHLVLPDDLEPGRYRLCEGRDPERCAHLEVGRS